MYWLGFVLAVLSGCLLGVFGTAVYITYLRDSDDYYEGCCYEEDD